VKDALVVVDAFNDFDHEDGDVLLASFRERVPSPEPGDLFVLKPRYSAFDHTPLDLLLRELDGG
jgi:nicotinamidase-related amidase